jgi:uncharacterized protein YcbX
MTIRIEAMYIAPVKSLALQRIDGARLEKPGIAGDRAFYMIDARGKFFTQRQHFPMVQVRAEYDVASDWLRLAFPDGAVVEGAPEPGERIDTEGFERRVVSARVVQGGFGKALSAFAGRPVRLVRPEVRGSSFDGYPLSMCSMESLQALALAAEAESVDGRRFRQNLYIRGATAHLEDTWIGGRVRAGSAVLSVKMRDERCVMTTRDPDTGEHDMDTLKIIAGYRTELPGEVCFGVYCTVAEPGDAHVGDEVSPLAN